MNALTRDCRQNEKASTPFFMFKTFVLRDRQLIAPLLKVRFPAELGNQAEADLKFKFLGKITEDEQLDGYVLNEKPSLDLPSDNNAYVSIAIMKTLGYLEAKVFIQFFKNHAFL